MKAEFSYTLAGEVSLELISETDEEYRLLVAIFGMNQWPLRNGRSLVPSGGKVGFYIPIFKIQAP